MQYSVVPPTPCSHFATPPSRPCPRPALPCLAHCAALRYLQYYSPTEKGLNSTGEAISYKADQLQASWRRRRGAAWGGAGRGGAGGAVWAGQCGAARGRQAVLFADLLKNG